MRVVERSDQEEHFSEGEPELEPPEELALAELDDEMLLEEELDSETVLEQDVDEDTLEATLEDLVHLEDRDDEPKEEPVGLLSEPELETDELETEELETEELDAEALDIADVEQSLDRILHERLALAEEEASEEETVEGTPWRSTAPDEFTVAPCRADEFVCRSCFLVCNRAQLADAGVLVCRDCVS